MLRPFQRFCVRIGAIPVSIIKSLSYEEQLIRLINYIKDTVIPAIDDNADAIEELQGAMVELQSYVNDYFDNLDVQEEIDNKLDQMVENGTIKSLINNEIFSEINNKIAQNTIDINANSQELEQTVKQGQTNSVSMEMLTQDVREALTGGSTAVVGVNSVGDDNIVDEAISIFKLDSYLQSTKSITYGDPKDLGERNAGFVTDNDGELSIQSNSDYAYKTFDLTKDKIYCFSGQNVYNAYALLVVDTSDDSIVYKTGTTSSTVTLQSLVFKVNKTGLRAYMSLYKPLYDSESGYPQYFNRYTTPCLREVNFMTNSFKKITPKKLYTLENYFLNYAHDSYGCPRVMAYTGTDVLIYEMVKGKKYEVSSYDYSTAVGIYILALDHSVIYQSSESSASGHVPCTYTFTASTDGLICLLKHGQYEPTITIVEEIGGTSSGTVTGLGFDKWFCLGDSITETNFRASKNYHDYIAEELNIDVVNLGHSGSGYMHENSGVTLITEIDGLTGYNYETDIITVMGSINDFSHIASSLGHLGDTTTDTLYGCMYVFCDTLFTSYLGARIGIICPTPTEVYHTNKATFDTYNKALKETAELFSIPVLDLSEKSNLKPWITNFKNQFFSADGTGASGQSDTTHPNSKGHWLIHNEIKEFIKGL